MKATARFSVGDSVRMIGWQDPRGLSDGSAFGVVRAVSPRRVVVWTGTTGFGQRRWPFDDKGLPVGPTKIAFPWLRLDLNHTYAP